MKRDEILEMVKREADLCWANLRGADLREADLRRAKLYMADLHGADLRWADLHGADLRGANLYMANLSEANLHGADLSWAKLSWADLRGADLRGTCLDPTNKPNGDVSGFEKTKDGLVIGYRTAKTPHILQYLVGRVYGADFFSTDDTECHPGLYLWPTEERAIAFSGRAPLVRVETSPGDVHKAGGKWRCRWFRVVGEVTQ